MVRRIIRTIWGGESEDELTEAEGGRRSLYLRNGDSIPCEVTRIDEGGISFKTPLSEATFVAHDKVKAVELVFVDGPPRLNKAKRERLLMLPRMQTPSPPTHLVRSKRGDFLRGQVLALDEKMLRVEVHLEEKQIPRNRISHIIWLHDDELKETPPSSAVPVQTASASCVQVLQSDGNRLTFLPEELAGTVLSGTSEVLGACRVDLTEADKILVGAAVADGPTSLAYHRWKLHRATEPIYIQVLDGPLPEAPKPGSDSPLIGKPAPDFELELLDGRKFRLANSKGRVVVLDFWATWCGPCMQTLPQVDRVIRELNDKSVQLIAVNLEEPASQITAILERHKLELTVALDRDGVVAARYEATAIPQTVVIDRNGKVARVFVGGGAQVADHLRNVVRDLLAVPEQSG